VSETEKVHVAPAFAVVERSPAPPPPVEVRVPLKEPLPLGACVNAKPPERCGKCWYDIAAEALERGVQPFEMQAIVKRGALGGRKR
jgi:hypothetical protein